MMSAQVFDADNSAASCNYRLTDLIPFIARKRAALLLAMIAGIVAHLGLLTVLGLLAWIVGAIVSGAQPSATAVVPTVVAVAIVVTALGRWLQTHFGHGLAFELVEVFQLGIFDGLQRTAPGYVLGRRSGELASIATSDAEALEGFYAHLLGDYVGAALAPIAAVIVLACIHPMLALAVLPFLPLIASVPFWMARRAGRQGEVVRSEAGKLDAELVEGVQGLRELVIFDQRGTYLDRLMRRSGAVHAAQRIYGARVGIEQAVIDALLILSLLVALCAALYLVSQGALAVALIPVVLMVTSAAFAPVTQATESARKLGELQASARRVLTIFHQPSRVLDEGRGDFEQSPPEIRFEHVGFSYQRSREQVLRNVSFVVKPATTVALVGKSGAGKSTSINLLLRFWDVDAGRITVGGRDLRDLPLARLRDAIAYVPQDAHVFDLTVAENIRLGRPAASDADVQRAAQLAQADDFIRRLPQGYGTRCGERGTLLSGGQKQRIAIARAFLKNAPVLLLDEPTSSLDEDTEGAVTEAVQQLRRGRTTLIVAHRPATIRSADHVVVLQEGRVARQASHEEAMP